MKATQRRGAGLPRDAGAEFCTRADGSGWAQGLLLILLVAFVALVAGYASGSARASFPGSNGLIAFVFDPSCETGANPPCDSSTIYVVSASGGRARPLIKPFAVGVNDPAWSPSGRMIAFDADFSVWIAAADGSALRRITTSHAGGPFEPAWSPDGKKLVFSSDNTSIGVMNADGSGQRVLFTGYPASFPTWSPNGKTILFERIPDVYAMEVNGEHLRRLLRNAFWPSWAPDGKLVAFASTAGLSIATANGHQRRLLVRGCVTDPVWSPDGTTLAYAVCKGPPGVYIVNADGTHRRRLTSLDAQVGLDWQPRP